MTPGRVRRIAGASMLAWVVAGGAAAAAEPVTGEVLVLSSDLQVRVVGGRDIVLEVRPWPGEGWSELASRVCGTADKHTFLEAAHGGGALDPGRVVRIALRDLSDAYRALVLTRLFPSDRIENGDWIHVARSGVIPTYDEGLWQVAEWFTGDGSRFDELRRSNGFGTPELAPGETVRIPAGLVHPALAPRPTSDDGTLTYDRDPAGEFAGYRLKPGEALWSSVVVRYTGRTSREDVESVASDLARRSGIGDLRDIPIGFLVKIPFDLLEPEFLPKDHARRQELEAARAEAAAVLAARPAPPATLRGVVVILDPGHGGRDLGTENNGVWEHDYVYDVAVRLKKILEGAGARVHMTLVDTETGLEPSRGDKLKKNFQGTIRTSPPFLPSGDGDSSLGVNLRWYLANSIYRTTTRRGVDADRVVFLSLHADARHPALRGAMVYVPGARYRARTEGSSSPKYTRFAEVRERPRVSFGRKDRIVSEAVSRRLADALVEEMRRGGHPVQDFKPVRDRVIRGRRTWLPAVLRGNAVPAKVLVEMVNLSNAEDAALIARAARRQELAAALAAGLTAYFGPGGQSTARAAGPRPPAP